MCRDYTKLDKRKKRKKITHYPVVVPIVIYTGKSKWKVEKEFKNTEVKETTYGKYSVYLKYNIININNYSKKFLIKQNTFFAYLMLIEKSKNKDELINSIELSIKKIRNKEKLKYLKKVLYEVVDSDTMKKLEIDIENEIRDLEEKEISSKGYENN